MEINFNKSAISYLKPVATQMKTQEVSQQFRIPDIMPDVESVVSAWGQVIIRSKQWLQGSIQVAGGVKIWVLYYSNQNEKPQSTETWIPFQIECDMPQQDKDGTIVVRPFLRNMDARTLSDRKIMIRANVAAYIEIMTYDESQVYHCGELPEDIQILERNYPVCLPVEAGEKLVNIEETLDLPNGNVKVVRCNVFPNVIDNKIISDKLVLRGNAHLDMLLQTDEGKIKKHELEIPYSQFVQLSSEYDSGARAEIVFSITELDMETSENDPPTFRCSFIAQYVVYDSKNIDIVEDAYSTKRQLSLKNEQVYIPSLLNESTQLLQAECKVSTPEYQIIDATVVLDELMMDTDNDKLSFRPTGAFHVLCEDNEGILHGNTYRWESNTMPIDTTDAEISAIVELDGSAKVMGDGTTQQLRLNLKTLSKSPISIVADLEAGEEMKVDSNRPSLIICPMDTSDLWTLAKNTGSTVESIMKANGINQEPNYGQMLLIPIR